MCLSGDAVDKWLSCDDVALDAGEREYPEAAKSDILYKPTLLAQNYRALHHFGGSPSIKTVLYKVYGFHQKKSYEPQYVSPTILPSSATLNESGGWECD